MQGLGRKVRSCVYRPWGRRKFCEVAQVRGAVVVVRGASVKREEKKDEEECRRQSVCTNTLVAAENKINIFQAERPPYHTNQTTE